MILPYAIDITAKKMGISIPWPTSLEDNIVADWYNSPWNEDKYKTYVAIRSFDRTGIAGAYFDYLQALYDDRYYLERNQMTYEDIKNPNKLKTTSAAANLVGRSMNFVSSNVSRLYR